MSSDESHFNVSLIVRGRLTKRVSQTTTFNVSLIVRGRLTKTVSHTTTFEEIGKPKRTRTEVLLLTSLTPYR